MKTLIKFVSITFFALLFFTSCQDEVIEETQINNVEETFEADSDLAKLLSATSTKDGSSDNIIDQANGLTVKLPVTVIVNGLQMIVNSEEDFQTIEAIFDEFEDDDDTIEIVFPITVILSDHSERVVNNDSELDALRDQGPGENEEDDDIECIDFQYPISFSIFNMDFQIINTVFIENDRELHEFLERIKNSDSGAVLVSLNYPVGMILSDGTEIVVHNNSELIRAIEAARHECDEDDDNDYNDDDFTKERLDNLLVSCPWIVHDLHRNNSALTNTYREYVMVFRENGVVKVRARNGDMLTGTWETHITDRGAKITLEFDTLVDFTLEWFVYEIEAGKIKLFTEGGNRIILIKACDIIVDQTVEFIENILKECFWRIARLSVDGSDNEEKFIGTPLKFFDNGIVKIRVHGEFVQGTWDIIPHNAGFVLQINLDGRPDLHLEWFITLLKPNLIKLENQESKMVLKQHCPGDDADVNLINNVLNSGEWEVALYRNGDVNETENYSMYVVDFLENGWVKVTDPNNGIIDGSWLVYRNDEGMLKLGLNFGTEQPFDEFNDRWKIVEITENRIELMDVSGGSVTTTEILVFEKL